MVNSYSLEKYLCVSLVAQLCLTLCNPVDCSPPGSSVQGIVQARILVWVAMPSSRGLPNPGLPHCRRILYQLSYKGSISLEKYKLNYCVDIDV